MLTVKTLKIQKENEIVLNETTLTLNGGETYFLMGPNGAGKSSLARTILGDPEYKVLEGEIELEEENILEKSPEERAKLGLFVSYQNPVEIPGLSITHYLRTIYNNTHTEKKSPSDFEDLLEKYILKLKLPANFKERYLNEGFSGGEKKKMEILQLLLLEPRYAILDEIDSGVDIDSLQTIMAVLKELQEEKKISIVFITHYTQLLDLITPDKIFIMKEGKIVKEGSKELIPELETHGYKKF